MIKIGETDYYLDADPTQLVLVKWDGISYNKETAKYKSTPIYSGRWYYSELDSLLNGIRKRMTIDAAGKCETLDQLLSQLTLIKTIIGNFAKEMTITTTMPAEASTSPVDEF